MKFIDIEKVLFEEIVNDYRDNGCDLNKVSLRSDDGSNLTLKKFQLGTHYTFKYVFGVFGKFNSPVIANTDYRDVKLTLNPIISYSKYGLSLMPINTFENNERSFSYAEGLVCRSIGISYWFANKIIKFFLNEFNMKYPDLKLCRNKNTYQIKSIENGELPIIKWISFNNMYGEEMYKPLRLGEVETELISKWYGIKQKIKEL